jgi:aminoglycoside phosphotransferase (APT) family kinase protein
LRLLPERYEDLMRRELPLEPEERERVRALAPRFRTLCDQLAAFGVPETIQHDDLHMANVYVEAGRFRVVDWGDTSISHPFASLVETFRFLEEFNGLSSDDPWFARLRDAYLEAWDRDVRSALPLALKVGGLAHAIAWARQRDALPRQEQPEFDVWFSVVLRRALAEMSRA